MKLRKFQAANMKEAIARVKEELGPETMIVATREIKRGVMGAGVEVTAAIEDQPERPSADELAFFAADRPKLTEEDVERIMAPLRSELRSIRSQLRPADEVRGEDIKDELSLMRRQLAALKDDGRQTRRDHLINLARGRTIAAPSQKRTIALIGPTGVGKTTTIAKIAAREALIEKRTVGLISVDDYRVGGQEQIRVFADLIGVPLAPIEHLDDLPAAAHKMRGYDRLLIDTAGRSPRDKGALCRLVQALLQVDDCEIHLAVAASTRATTTDDWVNRYGAINIDRLLFTKVDETDELSELVEAPLRNKKPVSFITNGQRVPEDLEYATNELLLSLAANGQEAREAA